MWVFLALVCAFLVATSAAFSKIALRRHDEYFVGFLRLAVSSPFLLLLLFLPDIPQPDVRYFKVVAFLVPLDIISYVLYNKAIKNSPLSLTMPFMSLTPVFLLLTGFLILGEKVGLIGSIGISLVVFGAYIIKIEVFRYGVFAPIRAIYREKGVLYMIAVAFIYSITAALGKKAIGYSSPIYFSATYFPIVAISSIPIILIRYKASVKRSNFRKIDIWLFLLIGVAFAASMVSHSFAITMTKAAYMITVKRMSMLFGVIYGWLLFKEGHILNRLLGAALMILGVLLVSLG
ncbi:EamA family transporter [Candidatus Omnitrophota bacterium]